MSIPASSERSIFEAAIEKETPAEREAYLDQVCSGDLRLRQEIESLLAAHDRLRRVHEFAPGGQLAATGEFTPSHADDRLASTVAMHTPGTVIGPYRLMELLGEGGMGLVFVAEQERPVRRRVALKIIKPGMDSRQVIARFEAERQALALMDHPNIAKVFDGGTTDGRRSGLASPGAEATKRAASPTEGRPYFVMELVRGKPITDYCDAHRLTTRERLKLFLDVCAAVQHAHQKGIIHRDIKPSNVLVSRHDTAQVVKVIDFGIAKAISEPGGLTPRLTDHTVYTTFAQMVGTPLYMSPEQAGLSDLDVDTRSDVYALGVLLYELLTGTTPFDSETLKQAGYDEMRRIIREDEPPKPSARLTTMQQARLSTIAQQRGLEPRRLSQQVRGELDWIAMRALEKDRNRRYESASTFAADVQRYLRDEPVAACPPTALYRFHKFARRNRAALAMASVVGAALAILVVGVTALIIWRSQERERFAEEQRKLAEDRAAEVQEALDRLSEANNQIQNSRWHSGAGEWAKAHEALTRAVALRPDHSLVWLERGDFYMRLDLWDLAAADYGRAIQLQKATPPRQRIVHALLLAYVGDMAAYQDVAVPLSQQYQQVTDRGLHYELARACTLAPASGVDLAWAAKLVDAAQNNPPRYQTSSHNAMALVQYRAGDFKRAIALAEEVVRDQNARLNYRIPSGAILAMAHHRLGHIAQARQALTDTALRLGESFQFRLEVLDIGERRDELWDVLAGLVLYREAKTLIDGSPPPPDTREVVLRVRALLVIGMEPAVAPSADIWFHVGKSLRERHNRREALDAYSRAISLRPDDPWFRQVRANEYASLGLWDNAAADLDKALELDPAFAAAWSDRGNVCYRLARWDQAIRDYSKAIELQPNYVKAWAGRASTYMALNRWDRAIADLGKLVELQPRFSYPKGELAHWLADCPDARYRDPKRAIELALQFLALEPDNIGVHNLLGVAYYRAGNWQAAIEALEKSVKLREGGDSYDWFFLAMAYWQLGEPEQAQFWLIRAVEWVNNNKPNDAELGRLRAEAEALFKAKK